MNRQESAKKGSPPTCFVAGPLPSRRHARGRLPLEQSGGEPARTTGASAAATPCRGAVCKKRHNNANTEPGCGGGPHKAHAKAGACKGGAPGVRGAEKRGDG